MLCQDSLIKEQVLPMLGSRPRKALESMEQAGLMLAEEIRLRPGHSLLVQGRGREVWLPLTVNVEDLLETMNILSQYSYYAFAEQLARGYITVAGGHRIGVAGRVTVQKGRVAAMAETGSINIRIARQVKGAGKTALPWLFSRGQLLNTLILAAPGCGKTTLLRDLIRLISDEAGLTVGVADERSELAGCYRGIPQLDVGCRTDVLDGCPRDQGLEMLVRSMGPQVVAADEIGRRADARALENVLAAGVAVLTTAHARDLAEARQRPVLRGLLAEGYFQRAVILGRREGRPEIAGVAELPGGKLIYRGEM
ncbi:MAG: stage III sporulation protein AA [Eubacteriales bacterium]|nr:stage III sporulation protein AA [Eubacteriales bacterium]MDD3073481.1 stage III sporulation protein AA [Eubacteriales bacterium]MDD4078744.1 stage III sporulation protein AA [Eubacteriales bacterium]